MAFFIVPVPSTAQAFEIQVEMNTELFTLAFRFYPRDDFWRMTVSKADAVILSQIKVVNTLDLLGQFDYLEDLPAGTIIVFDHEGLDADPGSENFGDRVVLMYQDAA